MFGFLKNVAHSVSEITKNISRSFQHQVQEFRDAHMPSNHRPSAHTLNLKSNRYDLCKDSKEFFENIKAKGRGLTQNLKVTLDPLKGEEEVAAPKIRELIVNGAPSYMITLPDETMIRFENHSRGKITVSRRTLGMTGAQNDTVTFNKKEYGRLGEAIEAFLLNDDIEAIAGLFKAPVDAFADSITPASVEETRKYRYQGAPPLNRFGTSGT